MTSERSSIEPLDYANARSTVLPPAARKRAVASLVCGVLSLVSLFVWVISLLFSFAAITLGLRAHARSRRRWSEDGLAVAGIACGAVGLCASVIVGALVIRTIHRSMNGPPLLLPAGPPSRTFYSKPNLPPEFAFAAGTKGVYSNGHLLRLRVTSVDPSSRLGRQYGLRVGDEITAYSGKPVSDVDDEEAAKAWMLQSSETNDPITVLRNGRTLILSPLHPTSRCSMR